MFYRTALRTGRKPMPMFGLAPIRSAHRMSFAGKMKLPPLWILLVPDDGPVGSICGSEGNAATQSEHHSYMFPSISNKPHGLACLDLTTCVPVA